MMSCHAISGAAAGTYFEHESDYYTQNRTCYDKWHGSLAETMGAKGELSKEQFDKFIAQIESAGRTRTGVDCAFSAPKSVSLAMAADDATRSDMIAAHQAAVDKIAKKIELQYIGAKTKNGIPPLSRNMVAAEFVHTTARPTEANNFVPDLDLHSHLYIHNMTIYDGKLRAVDFKKLMDNQKELGLEYRRELAHELQERGYELELTDARQGFFELKGFDRETIEKYSNREAEILRFQEATGATKSEAKIKSRTAKDRATKTFDEISRDVREDLFNGKIKIRKREAEDHAREDERREKTVHDGQSAELARAERDRHIRRDAADRAGARNPVRSSGQSDITTFGNASGRGLEEFADRPLLSELPVFDMAEEGGRDRVLVPDHKLSRLAELQAARVRDSYMQRAAEIRRGDEIDNIAKRALDKLSAEKYAFSIHEAQQRIIAEGLLENVRKEEAEAALERAEVVRLGRMKGDRKNEYVTTEANLTKEQRILERVREGKGTVTKNAMTQEEANDALHRAEARLADGKHLNAEQTAAVEHILSCQDRYVGVNGLAGTGKTMMLQRVREICDEQGIKIEGACFTGKAASGLEADSQIKSGTIHSFLNKLEKESGAKPPPGQSKDEIRSEWDFSKVQKAPTRELWIVDEAGLVDNNLMYQLQAAAEARGAQVVLVGDPDQLPPVGLGEPMRMMEENGMATAHLTAIRRQTDLELLRAVQRSVSHDAEGKPHLDTFEILEKKGDYREISSRGEKREAIKNEMTADKLETYQKRLLLTSTNAERKALNKMIRKEYVSRGELAEGRTFKITVSDDSGKTHTETRQFAEKDRVIFTANDNRAGVLNGEIGSIEKIDGNRITVKIDTKPDEPPRRVTIDTAQYNSLDHSYCLTNYKAQGMTIDLVVCDMDTRGASQTRNALYVDISRARQRAIVFTNDKKTLERQTLNFAKKVTSKDFSDRISELRAKDGIKNNDRYHAPTRDLTAEMNRALKQIRTHTFGSEKTMGMDTGKAVAAAATIPVEVSAKMLQAAGHVASLIPVVGKAIAAPLEATGKAMEKVADVVKKGVEVTVKTAKGTYEVAKNAASLPKTFAEMAQRVGEAQNAREARAREHQPQLEQGYARTM